MVISFESHKVQVTCTDLTADDDMSKASTDQRKAAQGKW